MRGLEMDKKYKLTASFVLLLSVIFCFFSYAFASNISDWGIIPVTHWDPTVPGITYEVDYQGNGVVHNGSSGYLDPGYGGHAFDAEAIYISSGNGNLYYAIVTGFPNTGSTNSWLYSGWQPGDIAFDFGIDDTYEYGIATTNRNYIAGNLYSVTQWGTDIWGSGASSPTDILGTSGSGIGGGSLTYAQYLSSDHWVIEGYIPQSAFGPDWGKNFRVYWT